MSYNKEEIIQKLEQAQRLLSDVYHYACNSDDLQAVESWMSCADGCILDSLEFLTE